MATKYIRNFSIIAHIDHGKSTLADRLLEMTGTVTRREMEEQLLDTMDLERERGITIKAQSARLLYDAEDGHQYTLNLIDTPGHVDFNYEVSRSLAACEGALLVVDATQGVEAQTLANVYLALEHDLEIIPIINKVDLPSADPERVCREIEDVIGLDTSEAVMVSAKTGLGVDKVLEEIVTKIPEPRDESGKPLRALIFDSRFDPYKGAIANIRIMEGSLKTGDTIRMMSSGKEFEVIETGVFLPRMYPVKDLECGSVGYFAASMKNVRDCRVGDTVTGADKACLLYTSPSPRRRRRSLCRAIGRRRPWFTAASIRPIRATTITCGTPWKSSTSMTPPFSMNLKHQQPSASAFAAVSWGSFTWMSSKSGSSGNTAWP